MNFSLRKLSERIHIDWYIFIPALFVSLAGLFSMNSFSSENPYFLRQGIWLIVSVIVFIGAGTVDWRFLRQTRVVVPMFLGIILVLASLFFVGQTIRGSQSWFRIGSLAFQPSDPAKYILILMLAKYFSRRHIEIRNLRHIIVSGLYAFVIFFLVFLQPDFGSAMVVFSIWFGMVLVSGISKKHLMVVALLGITTSLILWSFVFAPYQKARILTFVHPLADVRGAGYNAYQSTVAVGSGQIFGKGLGQGSQSKLRFLPEHETDFIFAAFVEEWGFVGGIALLSLCLLLLFRLVNNAERASSNFDALYGLGVVVLFSVHIIVNTGMNVGVLPVTGITFPLMSYGGSHLLTEWLALGILSSMKRHSQGQRITNVEV
jgi:rod shape determining protein RodA